MRRRRRRLVQGSSLPGLATQNSKETYSLSDMDMPRHYPTWPAAQQVQDYLDAYTDKHDLRRLMQFGTKVERADPTENGWEITTKKGNKTQTHQFEHLVVATGTFSRGKIPDYKGVEEWKAAGGHICHSSDLGLDPNSIEGKDVIVVGYGKSSCDVANAVSANAKSTTLVARRLIWKLPRMIRGIPYQYLLLTRLGESLFEYITPSGFEKWFNSGSGRFIRNGMLNSLQWVVTGQLKLAPLGLVPQGRSRRSHAAPSRSPPRDCTTTSRRAKFESNAIRRSRSSPRTKPANGSRCSKTVRPCRVICSYAPRVSTKTFPSCPSTSRRSSSTRMITSCYTNTSSHRRAQSHIQRLQLIALLPDLFGSGCTVDLGPPRRADRPATGARDDASGQTQARLARRKEQRKHAHGTNLVPFSLHSIDDTLEDIDLKLARLRRSSSGCCR